MGAITHGLLVQQMHVELVADELCIYEILQSIEEHINYLTVITENPDQFEEVLEDVSYDSGLEAGLSSSESQNADLIIRPTENSIEFEFNTSYGKSIYDGAVYLLDGQEIDGSSLQKKIWNSNESVELFRFEDPFLPDEYKGRIIPEKLRKS